MHLCMCSCHNYLCTSHTLSRVREYLVQYEYISYISNLGSIPIFLQLVLIIPPIFILLYPQVKNHLDTKKPLQFLPGINPHILDHLSFLSHHDAHLGISFHVYRCPYSNHGFSFYKATTLNITIIFVQIALGLIKRLHSNLTTIRQFRPQPREYRLANQFRSTESIRTGRISRAASFDNMVVPGGYMPGMGLPKL